MTRTHHALVVQGGGMRGAYAAGAIAALVLERNERFDEVLATSSGAASCAYAAGRQEEGVSIWREHLHGSRLISPGRAVLGGPLLDLDYLIEEVFQRRVPLDVSRMRSQKVPILVPATDVATGDVAYFDLLQQEPFSVLRAAMSLPGAVPQAVSIEGRSYVDGGVVDQLPLQRALGDGATHLTVVMTREPGYQPSPIGSVSLRFATRRFPGIREALLRRHERYERETAILASPPEGVTLEVIRPGPSVKVRRWTRSKRRLNAAVDAGRRDALAGGDLLEAGKK